MAFVFPRSEQDIMSRRQDIIREVATNMILFVPFCTGAIVGYKVFPESFKSKVIGTLVFAGVGAYNSCNEMILFVEQRIQTMLKDQLGDDDFYLRGSLTSRLLSYEMDRALRGAGAPYAIEFLVCDLIPSPDAEGVPRAWQLSGDGSRRPFGKGIIGGSVFYPFAPFVNEKNKDGKDMITDHKQMKEMMEKKATQFFHARSQAEQCIIQGTENEKKLTRKQATAIMESALKILRPICQVGELLDFTAVLFEGPASMFVETAT